MDLSEKYLYENPLIKRYGSREMNLIWSPHKKFTTWRRLWIYLAEAQQELGLNITDEQLEEMRSFAECINYNVAEAKEKELRHDVMSHISAYGEQCPLAKPIIHLGATSQFVNDNTEVVQISESLELIRSKLLFLIHELAEVALRFKDVPTLGYTHFQPAQLVTVGKRAALWCQDFLMDYQRIEYELENLLPRGAKGTTGTQASFLELFENDHQKVVMLDEKIVQKMGFKRSIPLSGQTYTRKIDFFLLACLSGIAQSAHKMATDLRLLSHLKEVEEPFEQQQGKPLDYKLKSSKKVGSSAMAYKRNPMRCERICSLARYVMNLIGNTATTHSIQWFERTLDDSANRRIILPESFLATESILNIAINVIAGIQIWPKIIQTHLLAELPFITTEAILMECVKAGGDRQVLHEAIREHSMQAVKQVKEGRANDLIHRIKKDEKFFAVHGRLDDLMNPRLFIGRARLQVEEFVAEYVNPVLERNKASLDHYISTKLSV